MRISVGLAFAGGLLVGSLGIAIAAQQPHMEGALHALENARGEILVADRANDHGGHAGAATNLIDQAIHEVREGIRYRNERGP